MARLNWSEVRDDWVVDGGLRDVYVYDVTKDDWQRLLDVVRARGWPTTFSVDGDAAPTPASVQSIFELAGDRTVLWQIRPHADVAVNCHFYFDDEIELDVSPSEIVGQEQFDAVCELVTAIGRGLGKPVDVTNESARDQVLMRYEPSTDRLVRVPPPPTISLLRRLLGGG